MYCFVPLMHPSDSFNPFDGWTDYAGLKREWKELSGWEKVCDSIIKLYDATTLGGYVFSQKHWEMAKWDHSVIHGTVAFFQGLPIAGIAFVALEVVISLVFAAAILCLAACGSTTLRDANEASADYFWALWQVKKRQGDQSSEQVDSYLQEQVRHLFLKGDPTSLKRAEYMANRISNEGLREEVLKEIEDPEKNPEELEGKVRLFEQELNDKLTAYNDDTLENKCFVLARYCEARHPFYKNIAYEKILEITSDSEEFKLSLPYEELSGDFMKKVDEAFNKTLNQKLERIKQAHQERLYFGQSDLETTIAYELIDFAEKQCDYPEGKNKVYKSVIDIAVKYKNTPTKEQDAIAIAITLPYDRLSPNLQKLLEDNWPAEIRRRWGLEEHK